MHFSVQCIFAIKNLLSWDLNKCTGKPLVSRHTWDEKVSA